MNEFDMAKKMNRDELEDAIKGLKLLRKVVKKSKVEHYQNDWGIHAAKHKPKEKNYCGTMCCAAGKFALSKEGRKRGVTHEWERESIYDPIKQKDVNGWSLSIGGSQSIGEISEHIGNAIKVPGDILCTIFDSTSANRAIGDTGIEVVVERINYALDDLKAAIRIKDQ